jgi:hypothetical protein
MEDTVEAEDYGLEKALGRKSQDPLMEAMADTLRDVNCRMVLAGQRESDGVSLV